MTHPDDRRDLHARITVAAHEAFHDFADEEGCSVTTLLEAFARRLDTDCAASLAADARRISAERRRNQ